VSFHVLVFHLTFFSEEIAIAIAIAQYRGSELRGPRWPPTYPALQASPLGDLSKLPTMHQTC
jgi:hypothetical protein